MAKKKNTKSMPARNHAVDYLVTAIVTFLVVVLLGFFYVEDIRIGISVIVETFMAEFFPDVLP